MNPANQSASIEAIVDAAQRQRRWLRRLCWAGILFVIAALVFVLGHPLFVRWQLRQHGWILGSIPYPDLNDGLPTWAPDFAHPLFGRINYASLERVPPKISDIDSLRHFPKMADVAFQATHVSEQALAAVSRLQQVGVVQIVRSDLDEAGLRHLAVLPLSSLGFEDMPLGEIAIANIASCRSLEFLGLIRTPVKDDSLVHLSKLDRLRWLNLVSTGIGDQGLDHVSHCANLEDLWIVSMPITDASISHLSRLTKLRSLDISNCGITDEGAKTLADACRRLVALHVNGTLMADDALTHIATFPRLRRLEVRDIPITDDGIRALKACATLEYLNVENTKVTSAGLDELRRANPKLEIRRE
jgi:hypothetical protein